MNKLFFRSHCAVVLVISLLFPAAKTFAATYYVSQSAGDDSRDGLAAASEGGHSPWKTLAKASSVKYQPGDQLPVSYTHLTLPTIYSV